MIEASLNAAWFAPKMSAIRQTRFVLFGILALAAVALGFDKFGPEGGTDVPATVVVEGQEYNLRQGKVFLYFFNPTCLHCLAVGKDLSKYTFAADLLKETFPFNDVPYAAAIEDGKVLRRYTMIDLEEPEMGRSLRELGIVN